MSKSESEIRREAIEDFKKENTYKVIEFAKQLQSFQQIQLEEMSKKNKYKFYKKYRPEQVDKYLSDPIKYEHQLIDISRYLTISSPQYWRLMYYFPSIAILCPIVIPFDTFKIQKSVNDGKSEKILKEYHKCVKTIDNMNRAHEYLKALLIKCREDVFYGYEIETENSYYIKQLNPKYCRISGKYDGSFIYEFDFSYFNNKDSVDIREYNKLDREFLKKYNLYKNKGEDYRWQELNLDKEVCIKFQESLDFSCPPYISVFNDLYDITDYKELNKAKVEMDNTRFIGFEMETKDNKDSNKIDDFKLDTDTMKTYFAFIQSCLQGKVGAFMSPMPFKEIEFTTQSNNIDTVSNSIKSFWSSTGVADVLVGENKNAGTLKYSIMTDESLLFNIYKQIKRILSRKIKQLSKGLFVVDIPNFTIFNINEQFDKYLKASQYGFQGSITYVEACLGMSQNISQGLGIMESLTKKHENMIPVSSSYTQSDEGGRPKEEDDTKVSDTSQQTRDNGSNDNK